ncbi:MAG: molybdopterin molybdotransferase MoeA [Gammaproteobacteria bacterium]|nr:molybdopterin molybdotransferase MoeA [Gammaproteobacteria bacterium]
MKNELTPIDDALKNLLGGLQLVTGTEVVELAHTVNRIVAADLVAPVDVPGSDNSAMDGYAVTTADLKTIPILMPVSQRIAAGSVGESLTPATAARIFTGAPLPGRADAVVMQENCEISEGSVTVLQKVTAGENVRKAGEDISEGAIIFTAGHRIRVQDMSALASSGIATLKVRRKLKVAVLTTGDELVRPGALLGPGKIYNSNYYAIASALKALGMEVVDLGIVADDLDSTIASLKLAASKADCIISSGGVSVGEEDHVKEAVVALGQLELWKIAIKPGKPFAYGSVLGKPFFGLPGNPVSAIVTLALLVKPALLTLSGARVIAGASYQLPAGFKFSTTGERQQYLRVVRRSRALHGPDLILFSSQSSGVGYSLSAADGLAVVPPFTSVDEGDMLTFLPFTELLA